VAYYREDNLPLGFWQHPRGNPLVQDGAEAEARFPRCLLQFGTLLANCVRLERLRHPHEETCCYRGRADREEQAAVGAPAPLNALPPLARVPQADRR
jgi:hypothetical protein